MTAEAATGLHHVEQVMGMAISFDLRDPWATRAAIEPVLTWLHHVDSTFSTYDNESEISRLGRGELSFEATTHRVRDVLHSCEELRLDSEGAFDVFAVPAPNGTTLDPSGYVKGWSIEHAADILDASGHQNYCINAGGDIVLRGRPAAEEDWQIGIRHPHDPTALAAVVHGSSHLAIATSASYERGDHIVDPRTGDVALGLASATVVGPDLALADAYATTLFVLGHAGLSWVERHAGYDAYVIDHEEVATWTAGFNAYR